MTAGEQTLLDTRDLDEAREAVGAAYCPHTLEITREGGAFHAVQRAADVGAISVHSLRYGATMLVDPVPLESWLLVSSPLRGRLRVRSGREERTVGVGESVVLDPFRKFTLSFEDDCMLRTFRFERQAVERVLAELIGTATVRCGLGGPRSRQAAEVWRTVSGLLERHALAADFPLLQAELERLAVAALVDTHPMYSVPPEHPPAGREPPAKLHRVTTLIEVEPERPFRTGELAAVAGLSTRALQEAFQRHFGITPLGYVRDVRLRRAHEELVRADPETGTVADVAYRWGFGNLGRFARVYAQRYGCHPSDTLRR